MIINPIAQVGGFLNRATVGNMQRAGMSINRGISGAVGSMKGTFKLSEMQGIVQTFGAREILDNEILREQLKNMSKYAERLNSFDSDTFSKIYKTYSSNPRKLTKVVKEIMQIFIDDITAFHDALSSFINALTDALSRLDKLDEELMSSILSFLTKAEKLAEDNKFNLPPDAIETVKNKLKDFIKKQTTKLDNYSSDEAEEYSNIEHNNVGHAIKTMPGISWVAFKGKRIIDKVSNTQLQIILQDIAELERQIEAEKLEINFFPMVQEYLGSVDSCEDMAKDFKEDLNLMFSTVEKDYVLVNHSVAEFILIVGNEGEEKLATLKNKITEIQKIVDEIKSAITIESKNIDKLKQDLAELQGAYSGLLDNIRDLSKGMLNRIKDPTNANKVLTDYAARK